jgi:hypothetical protein
MGDMEHTKETPQVTTVILPREWTPAIGWTIRPVKFQYSSQPYPRGVSSGPGLIRWLQDYFVVPPRAGTGDLPFMPRTSQHHASLVPPAD